MTGYDERCLLERLDQTTCPRSLYEAIRRGLVPVTMMSEAWKILAEFPDRRRPTTAVRRGLPSPSPWQENAVRAWEDACE